MYLMDADFLSLYSSLFVTIGPSEVKGFQDVCLGLPAPTDAD